MSYKKMEGAKGQNKKILKKEKKDLTSGEKYGIIRE